MLNINLQSDGSTLNYDMAVSNLPSNSYPYSGQINGSFFEKGLVTHAVVKDKEGKTLMPLTYDESKWSKAAAAFKDAITAAEAAGYHLYTRGDCKLNKNGYPADPHVRALRYTITDYSAEDEQAGANSEVIWADSRDEGYYGIQNKSEPYIYGGNGAWNGVAPTIAMLSRFYTKNGLPIDEDKTFDYADRWEPVEVDEAHKDEAYPGRKTQKFNLDREPRYYAWVAFQNGYYEILSASNNGAYSDDRRKLQPW